METESHYFKVGLFLTLAAVAVVLFLGWMGKDSDRRTYTTYAIYFIGDVSGIKPGSSVKFKGIDVGAVQSLRFDERDPNYIRMLVSIDDNAPITANTVATIKIQDVIGTSAIALQNLDVMPEGIVRRGGKRYPTIPSRPSDLEKVISSLPETMETLRQLGEQGKKLMSDENIAALNTALVSFDTALASLTTTMGTLSATAQKSQALMDRNVVLDLRDVMAEAKTTLREMRMLAKTLREDPSQVIRGPKYKGYEAGGKQAQ